MGFSFGMWIDLLIWVCGLLLVVGFLFDGLVAIGLGGCFSFWI